jgi:hypothetical protein
MSDRQQAAFDPDDLIGAFAAIARARADALIVMPGPMLFGELAIAGHCNLVAPAPPPVRPFRNALLIAFAVAAIGPQRSGGTITYGAGSERLTWLRDWAKTLAKRKISGSAAA